MPTPKPMATKFQMIPDPADLAEIERDFSFRPADPARATTLAPGEVDRFNRDGFLTGLGAFSGAEMAVHRARFDGFLDAALAAGGDSYSINSAHLRHGAVYDLMHDPGILGWVRDLVGEDVVGWGAHYFCKLPGDGKAVAWHQDFSYWPLSAARTVTVWLAVDDADRENACMQFIRGSHRHGAIGFRPSETGEGNVLNQTVEDPGRFGRAVDVELKAGEASIHSDLLLHGSGPNRSNRRRCGLTLRYCPAGVRAHLGWRAKGVVVSGQDTAGNWDNPPRPAEGK